MDSNFNLTDYRLLETPIGEINTLPLEKAMNMPDHFQSNDVDFEGSPLFASLALELPRLLSVTASKESSFEERYLAASLLTLIGDPRISPIDPIMQEIPGCTFTMGISKSDAIATTNEFSTLGVKEEWVLKECPPTPVTLATYKIAKFPVTNADYKCYMDSNVDAECPPYWQYRIYPKHLSNHPVHSLSLGAIDSYIQWMNETTGRTFRLPTEAEWEFAAKGHDQNEYPWGNTFEKDHANTVESGLINTTPIGLFPKGESHCGCLDMAGNVEEYTSSYYAPYSADEAIMDDLLENGPYLIARGGSYTRFRDLARTTRRHGKYASDLYVMGFRLAEDV
ncbi:hypothetical protein A9Q99_25395 [Gammaproteobacteria bacterium 45_16_T64]|nr:hypothetical protein A9Q99_25395 [Gammaproteobacteria bacterium 45_16_T64]